MINCLSRVILFEMGRWKGKEFRRKKLRADVIRGTIPIQFLNDKGGSSSSR
jgi:hypothetical protein